MSAVQGVITEADFHACILRAALAPTVHNTQPARWHRDGPVLSLFCDTDVGLAVGDPQGRDAALSCGAVLEAMLLALGAKGYAAHIDETGKSTAQGQGLVAVAHLTVTGKCAPQEGLHRSLEPRFTWRGPFGGEPLDLYGWTRSDTRMVLDGPGRAWLAERNDQASFEIMQDAGFRAELLHWMRLSPRHPRAGRDGMDRAALRMSAVQAFAAPLALGRLWRMLGRFGATKSLTSEADVTLTAPLIALFHADAQEPPLTTGRAYLRLCLEAAALGLAGWPMAALSDHARISGETCARFAVPPERRLVQAIRFGRPTGTAPPRARRPLSEVLC